MYVKLKMGVNGPALIYQIIALDGQFQENSNILFPFLIFDYSQVWNR